MIRSIKLLGLAVVSLLVIAVAASAASAANFHSENSVVEVWGASNYAGGPQYFSLPGLGTFPCEAEFKGNVTSQNASTLSLTPTYANCRFLGLNTVASTVGCRYTYSASSTAMGSVALGCSTGNKFTFNVAGCVVTIPAQTPTAPAVGYALSGSGTSRAIQVSLRLEGVYASWTGAICGTGSTSNATLTGPVTLYGKTSGGAKAGIWLE